MLNLVRLLKYRAYLKKIRKEFYPFLIKRYLRRDWYSLKQVEVSCEFFGLRRPFIPVVTAMFCKEEEYRVKYGEEESYHALRSEAAKIYPSKLSGYDGEENFFTDPWRSNRKDAFAQNEDDDRRMTVGQSLVGANIERM